ncbi:MAG: acyl-CoA reductase, partial [Bacteroidota bacterium]
MNLKERITALALIGEHLQSKDDYLQAIMHRTHFNNPWLTLENQERAVKAIATRFLQNDKLENWLKKYPVADEPPLKNVGLVMAGNLPLVGFHDVLCVFAAGHRAKIKLSDKDKFLLPYLLKLLEKINPASAAFFEIVEFLKDFDAVIATGSNNSARYFEAYFGKKPNVIRRNRNAVAILDGSETTAELLALGNDVFQYFGLGCRNVSKIYVPKGYDFQPLLEALHEYNEVILHNK